MLHTTFNLMQNNCYCRVVYDMMVTSGMVEKYGKHTSIPLTIILEKTSAFNTLRCFRAVLQNETDEAKKIELLFKSDCVEDIISDISKAEKISDERPLKTIKELRFFLTSDGPEEGLEEARKNACMAMYTMPAHQQIIAELAFWISDHHNWQDASLISPDSIAAILKKTKEELTPKFQWQKTP